MTLLIRCIFKGQSPADERIIIEHTPPGNRNEWINEWEEKKKMLGWFPFIENPRCYRTLVRGDFYVFFLNETRTANFYKQMPFHELSFNDEATIEILKRTCRLQARPFAKNSTEETKANQCPIVSVGCEWIKLNGLPSKRQTNIFTCFFYFTLHNRLQTRQMIWKFSSFYKRRYCFRWR